jgi:hypothetical protein
MTRRQLAARLARIQAQLLALGPIHPGSLSEQYNVCGRASCACKDPKHPRKHGPYVQLSYTWGGKSTSRFVRPEREPILREKIENYRRFRELTTEWVDVAMALEAWERAEANGR